RGRPLRAARARHARDADLGPLARHADRAGRRARRDDPRRDPGDSQLSRDAPAPGAGRVVGPRPRSLRARSPTGSLPRPGAAHAGGVMTGLLVNLDVDDVERATDFYTRAFDLRVGRRFGDDFVELVGAPAPLYLLRQPAG